MVPDHFYAFILSLFPPGITYAFSYGSAVVQQLDDEPSLVSESNGHAKTAINGDCLHSSETICNGNSISHGKLKVRIGKDEPESKMLDMVFVVDDPVEWHRHNLKRNPGHYSILGLLGPEVIVKIQSKLKAGLYFNVVMNINCPESVLNAVGGDVRGYQYPKSMKYGVIQTDDFIDDVTNWSNLYVSGRLHKPTQILIPPKNVESNGHNSNTSLHLNELLVKNYRSALVTSMLLLPSKFTEDELFEKITSLSYLGDFRMIIGEDKNKVSKIVSPSKDLFRQIYYPIIDGLSSKFPNHIKMNVSSGMFNVIYTIPFLVSLIHVLPSTVVSFIQRNPSKSIQTYYKLKQKLEKEMSDVEMFKMIISHHVHEAIMSIVWRSSLSQGIKGFFTTGFLKAIKYCFRKISKMYLSVRSRSSSQASSASPSAHLE